MSQDKFGYWPEGSAYRTPKEPPTMLPICPRCSSRHQGATPNCPLENLTQEEDHDAAD